MDGPGGPSRAATRPGRGVAIEEGLPQRKCRPRVVARVEAAGMPQHLGMSLEIQPGGPPLSKFMADDVRQALLEWCIQPF